MKLLYYIVFCGWYLLSLLPLRLLYAVSDILYFPLYYAVRYRRRIVRKNLEGSFPEKSLAEIVRIEKKFYRFFCDCAVENIKLFSMSEKQIMRRMTFSGTEDMASDLEQTGKNFGFIYLGHYCNWEWIASLACWYPSHIHSGQIYHPLYNKTFDRLFLRMRNRFGGENIPMKDTLRRIVALKRQKQPTMIGFIADQAPKWNSVHHWVPFLHRDTSFFIGTEQIGKQVGAVIYFADVKRVKRGHYHCDLKRMTVSPEQYPDYALTDRYAVLLEEMIRREPAYWLWSHNRWKRTKEEWELRNKKG